MLKKSKIDYKMIALYRCHLGHIVGEAAGKKKRKDISFRTFQEFFFIMISRFFQILH